MLSTDVRFNCSSDLGGKRIGLAKVFVIGGKSGASVLCLSGATSGPDKIHQRSSFINWSDILCLQGPKLLSLKSGTVGRPDDIDS